VVLLDTFTANGVEQAQVEVDGTVYDPSVGETFGPNKIYRLQSVSGNCATFLYGDESFTLCVEGAMEKQADFNQGVARSICAKQTGEVREACDAAVANGMYNLDKPSLVFYTKAAR